MDADNKEILGVLVKETRDIIRKRTLKGLFFGVVGAARLEKGLLKIYKSFGVAPGADFFSAASSTYYAAMGNAFSRAKESGLFLKLLWRLRAWKCRRIAKKYSDKFAALKPMEKMTLGELDARACVLRKARRQREALGHLSHGIMRVSTKQEGTKHDLCLFLIHEAEILAETGKIKEAEENYHDALRYAEDDVSLLTKSRVWKSFGKFKARRGKLDEAEFALGKALCWSMKEKLFDQTQKITAIAKDYGITLDLNT